MVEEIDLPESQPMQGEERADSSPPKKNNYFPDIKIKKHRTGVKISNDARESSAVSFFTLVSQRFQMIHASNLTFSFFKFSFAELRDVIVMLFGFLAAVGCGLMVPTMTQK